MQGDTDPARLLAYTIEENARFPLEVNEDEDVNFFSIQVYKPTGFSPQLPGVGVGAHGPQVETLAQKKTRSKSEDTATMLVATRSMVSLQISLASGSFHGVGLMRRGGHRGRRTDVRVYGSSQARWTRGEPPSLPAFPYAVPHVKRV